MMEFVNDDGTRSYYLGDPTDREGGLEAGLSYWRDRGRRPMDFFEFSTPGTKIRRWAFVIMNEKPKERTMDVGDIWQDEGGVWWCITSRMDNGDGSNGAPWSVRIGPQAPEFRLGVCEKPQWHPFTPEMPPEAEAPAVVPELRFGKLCQELNAIPLTGCLSFEGPGGFVHVTVQGADESSRG